MALQVDTLEAGEVAEAGQVEADHIAQERRVVDESSKAYWGEAACAGARSSQLGG